MACHHYTGFSLAAWHHIENRMFHTPKTASIGHLRQSRMENTRNLPLVAA
jgi:hypothetical protein